MKLNLNLTKLCQSLSLTKWFNMRHTRQRARTEFTLTELQYLQLKCFVYILPYYEASYKCRVLLDLLAIMIRIRDVPVSKFGSITGLPERNLWQFSETPLVKAGILYQIGL
jgi:hypothetical protein